MRQTRIIAISFLILGSISACSPTGPLSGYSSEVEIAEAIYFLEEGEEKVRAYLAALQAQSTSLTEIHKEEEESYNLELLIVMSKKFQDKSDQEKQAIASQIADLLANHIDYASYYTEILIVAYSEPISEILEKDGEADQFHFPISNWFEDE